MTQQYAVKGMTCGGCATNVKKALEAVPGVIAVNVEREKGIATVSMENPVNTGVLQDAVKQYGHYELSNV